MASITFKAKARPVYNPDETIAYHAIGVPVFKRSHCDMAAFREHSKFGGLANSDLFPNVLLRIRREVFKGRDYFRLDQIPEGITVDSSGFLTTVSFDV